MSTKYTFAVDVVEAIPALVAALERARAAINALEVMTDMGPKPRKLDEAMSWRENDEMAKSIVRDAKAAISAALAKVAAP